MSENEQNFEETQIRYVYGDQEYVLGGEDIHQELGDLSCVEGSKAILVDGQFIVTDNQTILLQDADSNLTQYYINCNNEGFIVDSEDATQNGLFEATECLQLVEEDTSDVPQIIYYANDDSNTEQFTPVEEGDDRQVQDEEGNVYPFKRIRLEGQLLNFEEFVQQQADLEDKNESMEYAILEDGTESRPESYTHEQSSNITTNFEETELIDLSKITGRNLITGQTVTLYSYMEKLKKRLTKTMSHQRKSPRKTSDDILVPPKSPEPDTETHDAGDTRTPELSDLLDKKISIGTTKSGKKIVGKIIHVEKGNAKKTNIATEENEEAYEENTSVVNDAREDKRVEDMPCEEAAEPEEEEETRLNEDAMKILVKKSSVSIDSFDEISKTLGGVMEMESVRKKLENKNIVVKLVEKRYVTESESFVKSTSYSYGYMEQTYVCADNSDAIVSEKWKFIPDQETQDVLLGEHLGTVENEGSKKSTKFLITTSLTIVVTYEKGGSKSIRVNLNPAPGNLCTICAQYFKTNLQLRHHMHQSHNSYGTNNGSTTCEVCGKTLDSTEKLQQHRAIHIQEGRLFVCSLCNKCFSTQARLFKHLPSHELLLRPLACSVCELRCANEYTLKKHLLSHAGIKPFVCDICQKSFTTQYDMNFHKKIHFPEKHFACNVCMRTFSRHSNLLRHMEIHKGDGALFKCEICCCSFNYISSLTRHMVQNHIEAGDLSKK